MPPRKRAEPKNQCKMPCCTVSPERRAEIRESAEATRGKSMFDSDTPGFRVQCRCGVPRKPPGLALHVQDDGLCFAHPDKPAQAWTRGAGPREATSDDTPPAG